MSDILHDIIVDLVFYRWGTKKTFKVVGGTIIGGAFGAVISAALIPDNPKTNNKKEND